MSSILAKRSGTQMWANVRAQVEAQFIRVPLWYEPVCAAPPLPQFLLPHKDIPKLDLPESRLYTKLVRKFPHLASVTRMHDAESKLVTVADQLVRRQLTMMEEGVSESDAFSAISREVVDLRYRELIDRTVMTSRAAAAGLPPTPSESEMLQIRTDRVERELARRAREARKEAVLSVVNKALASPNGQRRFTAEQVRDFGLSFEEQRELCHEHTHVEPFFSGLLTLGDEAPALDLQHRAWRNVDVDDEKSLRAAFDVYAADKLRMPITDDDENNDDVQFDNEGVTYVEPRAVDRILNDMSDSGSVEYDFLLSITKQHGLHIDQALERRMLAFLDAANDAQKLEFCMLCSDLWSNLSGFKAPNVDLQHKLQPETVFSLSKSGVDVSSPDSLKLLRDFISKTEKPVELGNMATKNKKK
eukprot:TRINITY_DN4289_c0_g1_i1.p1 TRINITY_DN4289_c0_g1~~TRINITY_DN4289_c0_g1_i1.p1  ORF type:complete len:430 (+),score=214.70 TRINITY_DN4289_c0_g1_i1:43-1290(+)